MKSESAIGGGFYGSWKKDREKVPKGVLKQSNEEASGCYNMI